MNTIHEPACDIPIAFECDLCVIGGSCTGVFAAVRAARLGLSVALVEQNIFLGGMAAAAQVNTWYSLHDAAGKEQIIGGLTSETLDLLRRRNLVYDSAPSHCGPCFTFNSAELALDLDNLVRENRIRLFLIASCVAASRTGNRVDAAILEDKSGRRAISARMFIDASGDGDLLRRAGFRAWKNEVLQPVNYQILVAGLDKIMKATGKSIWEQVRHRSADFFYPTDNATPWINPYPAPADIRNIYGPRLNGTDASDADQLTAAVLESRRCHRALLDMVREELSPEVAAVALAPALGIRETWHAACLHRLESAELLSGTPFPDSIARGTYPVDIPSPEGTLLRYLDGREDVVGKDGGVTSRRWRAESPENPLFYHIPYRCLVPEEAENLLVAGRLLDAGREAFGGVRVMVNMNQTGEAAGVAAWLALKTRKPPAEIDIVRLRRTLCDHGMPSSDL
jgi:2-polyprenyl-6-methoxyphenol hydroxylase-like FAD-dependent oxidoreductase